MPTTRLIIIPAVIALCACITALYITARPGSPPADISTPATPAGDPTPPGREITRYTVKMFEDDGTQRLVAQGTLSLFNVQPPGREGEWTITVLPDAPKRESSLPLGMGMVTCRTIESGEIALILVPTIDHELYFILPHLESPSVEGQWHFDTDAGPTAQGRVLLQEQ